MDLSSEISHRLSALLTVHPLSAFSVVFMVVFIMMVCADEQAVDGPNVIDVVLFEGSRNPLYEMYFVKELLAS